MEELDRVLEGLVGRLGPVTAGPSVLTGGITNRNYRVRFEAQECVVRLAGKNTSLLGISREAELLATRTAAELGISPRLLSGGEDCLVTEYLAAEISDAAGIRADPETVAAALRRFHGSGVGLPTRFWVPDLLDIYAGIVTARGGLLPDAYADARELARRIGAVLSLTDPVPCHNDLLPANLLRTPEGRIVLVDWEYAGMGHRMFDLGNLAVNAEFGETEEVRLLAGYLERPPMSDELAALRLMRLMSDVREAAWGVVQSHVSELDFDFEGYAARHFARLEAAATGARLEEWLGAATA